MAFNSLFLSSSLKSVCFGCPKEEDEKQRQQQLRLDFHRRIRSQVTYSSSLPPIGDLIVKLYLVSVSMEELPLTIIIRLWR